MKYLLTGCLSLFVNLCVSAQDSLTARYLSEVLIHSVKTESDTIQNFYRSSQSATTEEILNRMQGIFMMRRSAYGQEPVMRGMSGGQINVTIDGMRMFGACTDKMDPVTIYVEPQNLESIDATMGSNGAKFGSTIGGTLNMSLASPKLVRGLNGSIGSGYQSVSNGFNMYSTVNYGLAKSAYRASAIYRKSNNYKAGGGEQVEHSQYEKANVSFSGKWATGKDTIQADVLYDEGRNIGFPALPMDVGVARAQLYGISHYHSFLTGKLANLKTKMYANAVYHSMDDSQRDVEMHMDMPGWSNTYGLYTEGNFKALGKHQLQTRLDYYYNSVLAEMIMYPAEGLPMYMQTWPESDRSVTGLYISDDYKILSNTKLNFNFRLDAAFTNLEEGIGNDQLEVFYPTMDSKAFTFTKSANVSVRQPAFSNFIFQAHVGYGERLPTISEWYGFYLYNRQDGYDYLGNPFLETEKSWSGDLSLNFFSSWMEFQLSGFYQYNPDYIVAYIDGTIDPMTPGAKGTKVYENIAYSQFTGIELSAMVRIVDELQLINTTKSTFAQTNNGEPLPFIPPVKSVTSLRFNKKGFQTQVEWEASAAQNRVSTSFGEQTTAAYSVFNFRAGYKFKMENDTFSLNAGVENIFDLYYREHLDWGNIPRPGRNYYLTVSYKF